MTESEERPCRKINNDKADHRPDHLGLIELGIVGGLGQLIRAGAAKVRQLERFAV